MKPVLFIFLLFTVNISVAFSQEEIVTDEIFVVEYKPSEPPGGEEEMARFFKGTTITLYPKEALQREQEEIVLAAFFIKPDGSLGLDIMILNQPDSLFANEVIRAIKTMPKWVPASSRYRLLKYTLVIIPFHFKCLDAEVKKYFPIDYQLDDSILVPVRQLLQEKLDRLNDPDYYRNQIEGTLQNIVRFKPVVITGYSKQYKAKR